MRLVIAVSEDTDIYSMDDDVGPHNPGESAYGHPQSDARRPWSDLYAGGAHDGGGQEWTACKTRYEGGMGIDATVPYGYENDFMRPEYPVERVKLEDFFSRDEIPNVRARMKGWTELLAKSGR